MKKIKLWVMLVMMSLISFYYTNKMVNIYQEKDPIMQKLHEVNKLYKEDATNAEIIGNQIISGENGKVIDYEESYNKMKQYGAYNEALITLEEVKPTISIEDYYDKYIVSGNNNKKAISLIFIVDNYDISSIIKILEKENVNATFFIDGTFLEKNVYLIKKYKDFEFEILSYNNSYQEALFKTSISYLKTITSNSPKYCYTKEENEELLNLCKGLKLHTIKPLYYVDRSIYKEIKSNLSNGLIFSIDTNSYIEKELTSTIEYIKQKGYKLVSLNKLLEESSN